MELEENAQRAASRSVLLTKYYSGDQIKNNEMGSACGTYGGEERCVQGLVGKAEGRGQFVMLRRRWKIILKCIFNKCDNEGGMD
jgi:hypothetical protein